jgi:conjugal transfer pilus assembly protein TraB
MGSMVQGVLLNGLDAPTSGAAQKNPTPVLIRIKHDAILPNRARLDIKECFVIASGFGSMSTERANLRTEGISCVREDGGVIETNLSGYVIGEDGKVGMRGRLVSKQGSMIAKSLASGFLSGLGKALTPTGVVGLNLAPSGTVQTQNQDLGTAFEAGVLGGASNSLNQISRFYLDIAKEMVPVVEVDAGRPVTIVLTRGGSLRLSSK